MEAYHHSSECEFFSLSCDPKSFWLYLIGSLVMITAAGLMAGLTMGLVSLDMLNMRILEMEGSPIEKARAKQLIPILSRHHLLLVTLLLMNAVANEALPIFLSKLVPESVSILLSVTCVLLFGEIIPSAIFTGPNQLRIAAALTPMVSVLMLLTSPVSYPIAKLLDYVLGSDRQLARYKRQELKALVALQRESENLHHSIKNGRRRRRRRVGAKYQKQQDDDEHSVVYVHGDDQDHGDAYSPSYTTTGTNGSHYYSKYQDEPEHPQSPRASEYSGDEDDHDHDHADDDSGQGTHLHVDEVTIIHGALDLTAKTIKEVMIPIQQVFMLEYQTKLDANTMADILASGHSRIPIYKQYKSNIVGVLLVKRLIVVDPSDARPVCDLALRKPIVVSPEASCYHILNEFQKGHSHIALVTRDTKLVTECWQNELDIPQKVSFVGIITIEDVIEELIQKEIEDESDVYVHGIVDYWKAKDARKNTMMMKKGVSSGRPPLAFVTQRLKALAQRARDRVKNRDGTGMAKSMKKNMKMKKQQSSASSQKALDAPLEFRIRMDDPRWSTNQKDE